MGGLFLKILKNKVHHLSHPLGSYFTIFMTLNGFSMSNLILSGRPSSPVPLVVASTEIKVNHHLPTLYSTPGGKIKKKQKPPRKCGLCLFLYHHDQLWASRDPQPCSFSGPGLGVRGLEGQGLQGLRHMWKQPADLAERLLPRTEKQACYLPAQSRGRAALP